MLQLLFHQTAAVDWGRFSPPYQRKVSRTKVSPKDTKKADNASAQRVGVRFGEKEYVMDLSYQPVER